MKLVNDSKWLFKYMPFNFNAVKLLINNELWFGKPDILNDPNEAEFIIQQENNFKVLNTFKIIIQNDFDSICEDTDCGKKSLSGFEKREFEKELKKIIREYLGICSMSLSCDDILMWAHYADSSKGICFVFDKEIITKQFESEVYKVEYSSDIAKATFEKKGNYGFLKSDETFYNSKLRNWKYENEYRIVKRFNDHILQSELDRLESFNEKALVGVIIGEKFPKEDFSTLINLAYSKNKEREFYFWQCLKNLHKKKMDIMPITGNNVDIYLSQIEYPLQHIMRSTKARWNIK